MKKSLYDEMWRPLCKKILHPFVTKPGAPYAPVTKWGNPYGQTTYPYDDMWSPLCKKILNPFVTKSGAPYAPVTKR